MFTQKVLFTKEECNKILSQIEKFEKAQVINNDGIGRYDKDFRKTKISYLNSDKVKDVILSKLSSLDNTIISLPKKINILKYNVGDFFKKHQDRSKDGFHLERKKTLIIQLSDESYKGGILKVFQNTSIPYTSCSTEIGNTIIFDSGYYHEVTPMLEGERHALVGWFEESNLKQNSNI